MPTDDTALSDQLDHLIRPARLYPLPELFQKSGIPPKTSGVYAWWFVQPPPSVPVEGTANAQGLHLLYIGIAPNGPTSSRNLRDRLKDHCLKDASRSTLRKTLGCLLESQLGIMFRVTELKKLRVGLGDGEAVLSRWMTENARVSWIVD